MFHNVCCFCLIQQWQASSGLVLTRVNPRRDADIKLRFDRIDSRMRILGQALYPPIGEVKFDSAEDWNLNSGNSRTKGMLVDLEHETC